MARAYLAPPADSYGTGSVAYLFARIRDALSARYQVVDAPMNWYLTDAELANWVSRTDSDEDPIVGSFSTILALRRAGWKGPALVFALGDLSHGGWGYRTASRWLSGRDAVWFSCQADVDIAHDMVQWDDQEMAPLCVYAPYGITSDRSDLDDIARLKLRDQLGITPADLFILYPGRIAADKNPAVLCRAAQTLSQRGMKCAVGLVGEAREQLITGLGLNLPSPRPVIDRLTGETKSFRLVDLPWAKSGSELMQYLQASDVCVFAGTAVGENFGFGLAEALAAGRPLIATAWGGYRDFLAFGARLVDTWTSARGARIHGPQLLDAMIDVADGRVPEPAPHLPAELELHQFGQRIIGTIELLKRRQFSGKQKTQGAMRMTALGESLNQAFGPRHRKPGLSQFGSVPVYRDQSDERYTRIISRYSSLGMLPRGEARLTRIETRTAAIHILNCQTIISGSGRY